MDDRPRNIVEGPVSLDNEKRVFGQETESGLHNVGSR